jgi:hypothetical protein
MTKVVLITKAGTVKTETIKKVNVAELYKKCKYRKPDDFKKRHTWKYNNKWVSVYSKDTGRANSENKYDLPPPIDKDLYFGSLLIIMHNNETPADKEVCDFDKETWLKVYEKLFGGFDDLCEEEEESEEEVIPEHFKTKEGYSKEDGFIVDEDEEEVDEDYICPSEGEESLVDTESGDEEDDEAKYGGETTDDELNDEEAVEEEEDSDDYPASELSEEDYSY